MNKILLLSTWLLISCFQLVGQQTINGQLMHDGENRTYILYLPQNYNENNPIPLVLNFHGFGSSASDQQLYGAFGYLANLHNFIVVHPQGLLFDGSTHWNVGSFTTGSTVDDVGFTEALIDFLSSEYAVNTNRIYSTGMSNGGFMSYVLACELSDKIAAVASVTGSMGPNVSANCSPERTVPVLQIHGTDDLVVPFEGANWTLSMTDLMDFWNQQNNCVGEEILVDIEDTDTEDGSTVQWTKYTMCDGGIENEFYRVNGGSHTWPGAFINYPGTNYDIKASEVIWEFFSKYTLSGLSSNDADEALSNDGNIEVFPNPFNERLHLRGDLSRYKTYQIESIEGKLINKGSVSENIDLAPLTEGVYFLRLLDQNGTYRVFKICRM